MQRGQPVSSSTIDVRAGFQELLQGSRIVAARRAQDGRIVLGRGTQPDDPEACDKTGQQAAT